MITCGVKICEVLCPWHEKTLTLKKAAGSTSPCKQRVEKRKNKILFYNPWVFDIFVLLPAITMQYLLDSGLAFFHLVNVRSWKFFCWIFKKFVLPISKELSGKHWCQSVISTFLKSHFLLIDVFLGISRLLSGVVSGIQSITFYGQAENNFMILVFLWQRVNREKLVIFLRGEHQNTGN